jgi:hypothetical protein
MITNSLCKNCSPGVDVWQGEIFSFFELEGYRWVIDHETNSSWLMKYEFMSFERKINVPYDANLTPSNAKQKLKTYLAFL